MFLKTLRSLMLCTGLSIMILPSMATEDDDGIQLDLSSLLGGKNQQNQLSKLSDLLTSVVNTKPMSENTDSLKPVIESVSYEDLRIIEGENSQLKLIFSYDSSSPIMPYMPSLKIAEVDTSLWQYLSDMVETTLLAGTAHAPQNRKEQITSLQTQIKWLGKLLPTKDTYAFYNNHPALFDDTDGSALTQNQSAGDFSAHATLEVMDADQTEPLILVGLDEFTQKKLRGAFMAEEKIKKIQHEAKNALTREILSLKSDLTFNFALPRIDSVTKAGFNTKGGKGKQDTFLKHLEGCMQKGVVSITIKREVLGDMPEVPVYNLKTVNQHSSLSSIFEEFGWFVELSLADQIEATKLYHGLGQASSFYG